MIYMLPMKCAASRVLHCPGAPTFPENVQSQKVAWFQSLHTPLGVGRNRHLQTNSVALGWAQLGREALTPPTQWTSKQ